MIRPSLTRTASIISDRSGSMARSAPTLVGARRFHLKCVHCGGPFEAQRRSGMYCSEACKKAAQRDKAKSVDDFAIRDALLGHRLVGRVGRCIGVTSRRKCAGCWCHVAWPPRRSVLRRAISPGFCVGSRSPTMGSRSKSASSSSSTTVGGIVAWRGSKNALAEQNSRGRQIVPAPDFCPANLPANPQNCWSKFSMVGRRSVGDLTAKASSVGGPKRPSARLFLALADVEGAFELRPAIDISVGAATRWDQRKDVCSRPLA